MNDTKQPTDRPTDRPEPSTAAAPSRRTRRKWFPVAVVAALAIFWLWLIQSQYTDDYKNVFRGVAITVAAIALSIWFLACGGFSLRVRALVVALPWLLLGLLALVIKPVYTGDLGIAGWQWRFGRGADELLEASAIRGEASNWQTTPQDYPRFLGDGYWAEVSGVELETDWQSHPLEEVWRQPIGAGWSAFAVVGPYAVTQEQRGPHELVTCYRVADGELIWTHADEARFDPGASGPAFGDVGPRATPTIHDGKVITHGATGIVNCLDARTGRVLWSHDTIAKHCGRVTQWGKSNSPLVVDDLVVIPVGAPGLPAETTGAAPGAHGSSGASLVAYDLESGDVRWTAGTRPASYASPILATLAGVPQIICLNEKYMTSHRPEDGQILWEYPWTGESDTAETASQPVPLPGDRLFLSKGYGVGATLLQVTRDDAAPAGEAQADGGNPWRIEPLWRPPIKTVMKTKMGNVVVRDGHVYGLDGAILECIDIETGRIRWKERRRPSFGHGQILLVGDVLLILTESGELLAVKASPEEYQELASRQVLDPAHVTWNNPAFSPPYLLVRNAREAACYRLPLQE